MKTIKNADTLAQQAFMALRQAILNNELQPDTLYSASELGQRLGGISRTPVREAAQLLEKADLVRIEKNRGIRILMTSPSQLIETFQIRLLLEVPLVRLAAQNRTKEQLSRLQKIFDAFYEEARNENVEKTLEKDRDYHLALLSVAGNQKAIAIIQDCRNTVLLSGRSTIPQSRNCMTTFTDHEGIQKAVANGDGDTAARQMREHIVNTAQLLVHQESLRNAGWKDIDIRCCLAGF